MKDWKYILYISAAFGFFLLLKLLSPKQHDWTVTFAQEDQNPYGAYVFNAVLPGLFPQGIHHTYKTVYELKDSLPKAANVLIVASNFSGSKEDTDVLLDHVNKGGFVFISTQYFYGHFGDTLSLNTSDFLFSGNNDLFNQDSSYLKFAAPAMDTAQHYAFRTNDIHNYFTRFDTTRTTVIARNELNQPITLRVKWGQGSFILNTTPMAFTNIHLLDRQNHRFLSNTLSYLPPTPLWWTEYYQLGRREISTPLRFILTTEPLRWAYYITLVALLVFMVFEMKRKQRIIPIIKPLANTTLDFVHTIGNLYYQRAEHKNIAEKRIHYFADQLRTRYWLTHIVFDENFVQTLTQKSGKPEEEVRALVNIIAYIQKNKTILADILIEFDERLEKFNR
ncbi:hypothetical protein SAMN04488109_2727 [Chryseolinea serpens]|uniref:DUF4350 domain-containing protein n=1 Tax=Chryseolinea serpens TaxID=947013 RepID=A0A1M5P8Z1_9BACT|nr:DUF4350 domain-containing protein [Chryseolinea serpens]SHG97919.1 hypothetical protein SAMN04488109_2727 [Chryseolinea serpens]